MRLGVFGGSFDPVHLGHLVLAEQCREQACLDQVLFVPAARPPHKLDRPLTPFHYRVEMLEMAIAGYPVFQISQMEKDRAGPSFTVDTLRQLRGERPNDELFLLLGSDSLRDLPSWKEPAQIAELATLLVVGRPPASPSVPVSASFHGQFIPSPLLDISSRDIRQRVAEGRTIRYLVSRAVESYIETHHLYMLPRTAETTANPRAGEAKETTAEPASS